MIQFIRTNSTHLDFKQLVLLLDADLKIRDGEDHDFYHQFNGIENLHHVILVYLHGKILGCGALKRYDPQSFEIKRMYVVKSNRGQGLASQMLTELENWSRELGIEKCILETGINQQEAIGLYRKNEYHQIDNYGQYAGVEASLCFEKQL